MKGIILSLLVVTMHSNLVWGIMDSDDLEESKPKISATQKFFVAVQEIAHNSHFSWPLYSMEKGLGMLSDTYRFSNTLARVTFCACVLLPDLRQKAEMISVRLSADELNELQPHLSIIRRHIIKIAERQGLESHVPLLVRSAHNSDSAILTASTTVNAFVDHHKDDIFFRTMAAVSQSLGGGDVIHYTKEKNLEEMLYNFERIGPLASYIKVSNFNKEDNFRTEDINRSLDKIRPIFEKAHVF